MQRLLLRKSTTSANYATKLANAHADDFRAFELRKTKFVYQNKPDKQSLFSKQTSGFFAYLGCYPVPEVSWFC